MSAFLKSRYSYEVDLGGKFIRYFMAIRSWSDIPGIGFWKKFRKFSGLFEINRSSKVAEVDAILVGLV